jgi:signal transduction histidine kinase
MEQTSEPGAVLESSEQGRGRYGSMLHDFIATHRAGIIELTRAKIAQRLAPRAIEEELSNGVPLFLDQLIQALKARPPHADRDRAEIGQDAVKHGKDMLRRGFTVAQLVHDYGAVCQAITQLAIEQGVSISAEDYRSLNGILDDAIAEAVTGYGLQHAQTLSELEIGRIGFLAHELRNLLSTAILAYQSLRNGRVGITGNTGDVLGRSLKSLRDLVDRSLAEVRLTAGIERRERLQVAELIEEVEASATLDAQERGLQFVVLPVACGLVVEGDRQLLASAAANLVQNAFKFTRPHGCVTLRALTREGRILIEVEDECGGLPQGKIEELFRPFEQRGADRTGLGLGLAISRQSVKENGGDISVHNLPGKGCVFTIELPLVALPPPPVH